MYSTIMIRRGKRHRGRRGAAAVETAVVAPVLVVLFLGAVDMGQYANCYQKVSDAAREGARLAARFEVTDASLVETAVEDYLKERFPHVSPCRIRYESTVTVSDGQGHLITGSDLGLVETGSPIEVDVSLKYDAVRWMGGLDILTNRELQITSVMRRE